MSWDRILLLLALSVILMFRRYWPSPNDASGTVMPPGTGNFAGSNWGGRFAALTVCGLVLLKNFSPVPSVLWNSYSRVRFG